MAEIVRMPALSDTMEEGTLVAWHKNVGDAVETGELLAEIETDKAVMEFESLHDGTLLYIGVEEGSAVAVDAVIAVVGEEGEDYKAALEGASGEETSATTEEDAPSEEVLNEVSKPLAQTTSTDDSRLKVSPLARRMAEEEGINLSDVQGSGDDGRIVKRDIEAVLNATPKATTQPAATPQPTRHEPAPIKVSEAEGEYEDVSLSQMRKTIARRLGDSKFAAPHFYLTMEINMDKTMKMRKQVNEVSPVKISFNDFVLKACAHALMQHPKINASWLGDRIRYYKYVNMGVAVAVDEGLLVPVVRNAHIKSLSQIATEVREYAGKAKDRKLQPADMQGNTFTVSNLGMFGVEEFTAIINPPDACILAVGGINPKLEMREGQVVETHTMRVTLSCDHRVVDGAMGAQFLQTLKGILEDPIRLMV